MAGGKSRSSERRHAMETLQARAAWLFAADLAAGAFGADVRVVMQTRGTVGRGGDAKTSRARKVACYLALVVANASAARLSDATGIDRSTFHHHAEWVEDERDKPEFDQVIDGLETALFGMAARIVMARLGLGEPAGEAV